MSKRNTVNPSYEEFCQWYKENRPRFKTTWRKEWDEILNWKKVPGDFKFTLFTNEVCTKVNIAYSIRSGRCAQSITVGNNRHYYFTGLDAIEELAILADNGRIAAMGNDYIHDALLNLVNFIPENKDQLTLRTTHDEDGNLIYINASNGSGLMRVMLSLEEKE